MKRPMRQCPHCHSRLKPAIWSEVWQCWYCSGCKRRWCEIRPVYYYIPPLEGIAAIVIPEYPIKGLDVFSEWKIGCEMRHLTPSAIIEP